MFSNFSTNKKHSWTTGFLIFAVFFGCFLFGEKTQAEVIETWDIVETDPTGYTHTGNFYHNQQIKFTQTGWLTNLVLKEQDSTVLGPADVFIYFRDITTATDYFMTNTASSTPTEHFVSFATSTGKIWIEPENDYMVNIYYSPTNQWDWAYHTPSSTYNNTDNYDQAGNGNVKDSITTLQNWDWYVRATVVPDFTFSDIYFTPPTPSATCDFDNWSINYRMSSANFSGLSSGQYFITVGVGTELDGDWTYFDEGTAHTTSTGNIYWNAWVNKYNYYAYPGQSYYAQAYICDADTIAECDFDVAENVNNLYASSEIWQYNIFSSELDTCNYGEYISLIPGILPPTATSTNAGDNFTCDNTSGFFASSWCNLFQYLFKPSQSSMNNFSELKQKIEAKPPFGYFTIYKNALSGVTSATTTTSTINTTTSTLSFYRLSSLDFFDDLRDIIKWLLWITFIIYLFNRFKKFIL